jgi:hypothetical protein
VLEVIMLNTIEAVMHNGQIELLEGLTLPEGARVLVTALPEDEMPFWTQASTPSLEAVWDNPQDDVYAELLAK